MQADIRRRPATPGDCRGWSSAHWATLSDVQRRSERDWGSRGRRFKSGRPDWHRSFFEYSYTTQEPTKKPTCCATALLEARADRVPRPPYGHVPTRQSRPRPTVKEPKITEPPRICTTTPDNCEPAGTLPRPPADHKPDAHRGTATAGRRQARALNPGPPTPP